MFGSYNYYAHLYRTNKQKIEIMLEMTKEQWVEWFDTKEESDVALYIGSQQIEQIRRYAERKLGLVFDHADVFSDGIKYVFLSHGDYYVTLISKVAHCHIMYGARVKDPKGSPDFIKDMVNTLYEYGQTVTEGRITLV